MAKAKNAVSTRHDKSEHDRRSRHDSVESDEKDDALCSAILNGSNAIKHQSSKSIHHFHISQRTCSHEPRLDNEAKFGAGALVFDHLHGMVPSHTTLGGSASDKDDFALFITGSSNHFGSLFCT